MMRKNVRGIPRMGKIYHHAERVVAWLDLGLEVGEQLRLARDELASMGPYESLDQSWFLEKEEQRKAAEAVRNAQYWSRIWIMQEVMSAQLVVCLVGNMEVDNITLGRMVAFPENHHARTWERLQRKRTTTQVGMQEMGWTRGTFVGQKKSALRQSTCGSCYLW